MARVWQVTHFLASAISWLVKLWDRERQRPPQGVVHAIGHERSDVTAIGGNKYAAAQILTRGNLCSRLLFHIAQEPIYASLEGMTHLGYHRI